MLGSLQQYWTLLIRVDMKSMLSSFHSVSNRASAPVHCKVTVCEFLLSCLYLSVHTALSLSSSSFTAPEVMNSNQWTDNSGNLHKSSARPAELLSCGDSFTSHASACASVDDDSSLIRVFWRLGHSMCGDTTSRHALFSCLRSFVNSVGSV